MFSIECNDQQLAEVDYKTAREIWKQQRWEYEGVRYKPLQVNHMLRTISVQVANHFPSMATVE